jgi:hypothetical protein
MRYLVRLCFISVVAVLFFTTFSVVTLLAQGEVLAVTGVDSNPEIIDQYGGSIRGVSVQGNYAYMASGLKLITLDITDRSAPVESGYLPLPGIIRWIEVAGSHAYVTVESVGLAVVNISNPTAPSMVALLAYPDIADDTGKIIVSGQQLFLLSGGKLQIIDVTNPAAPTQIGMYQHSELGLFSLLDFANGRIFLGLVEGNCSAGSGVCANRIQIVNVTNPATPVDEGHVSGELPYDAAVYQNWLYVSDYYAPVKAINISDPMNPMLSDGAFFNSGRLALFVDANHLYMIDGTGVDIRSLADPAYPAATGYFRPSNSINAVDIIDSFAYVTTNDGLHIVTLQNPAQPLEVATYRRPIGSINGAVGSGDYLYIQERNRFTIVNAANPSNLLEVGVYTGNGEDIDGLNVDGNYAYLLSFSGLQIINIANPAAPQKVGEWKGQGSPHDLSVQGNYAYLMAYIINNDYELQIVDISDRSTPTLVGSMVLPRGSIKVSGNYVYFTSAGGVRVIDVTTPSAPQLVASYDEIETENVLLVGSTAYVGGYGGVHIVDISNPAAPQQQKTIDLPGVAVINMALDGKILYAAASDGLYVIDISNVSAPVVAQRFPLRIWAGITVHRGYLYLPDRNNGLYIIGKKTFVATDFLFLPSLFR